MEKAFSQPIDTRLEPLVSIMMTSYNRAGYLGAAIDTVLKQSYQNWELLILDDASTDNTGMVAQEYAKKDTRIRYLPALSNLGISKNRNRGFPLSSGKYIAVLDSDDLWIDEDKIKKQVEFLESHNDHVVVGTWVSVIDSNDEVIGRFRYSTNGDQIRRRLLSRNQFTHSAVLIRRTYLSEAPYDESGAVSIWEDYDLILRLGLKGELANLPHFMTAYRLHSNNISKFNRQKGALAHLSIIKRYRNHYPGYFVAFLKGYLRLLRSWI